MKEFFATITVIVIIFLLLWVVFKLGKDAGKQEMICQPGSPITTIYDNRVVCEMPDGGTEIRKF